MFIYKKKQLAVIHPRNAKKYTEVIPTAKEFSYNGSTYVAVPHRPKEAVLLQQLGVEGLPDPMDTNYPYNGRFKPFDVQRQTASFASMHPRCFILNSMGLGKTVTSLWAYDYLKSLGYVHKALVVCPISVMERAWGDEVFKSFPWLKCSVVYGTRAKRLKILADTTQDVYVINPAGLSIIKDALASRDDIDLVILDEVALFRNSSCTRWKVANEICNKQLEGKRRVWGLTGSPIPNAPTDAFGQIKLVTPTNPDCPRYFGRFRDLVMVQKGQFQWIPKGDAVSTVYRIMQPAIRFSLDDAVDLPPQIKQTRKVGLTDEQKKAYKAMMNKLYAELEGGTITAVNEAVKVSKLLQICCGVAYGDNEQEVPVPCTGRLEALDEVVNESEGKVIVFIPFTSALQQTVTFLREQGHDVAVVDGSTPKSERDGIFWKFQETDQIDVIVANPSTMSHGLTLTAATTICWFGPCYSNEVYQQACARVRRPGQKRATVIVHMVSTQFEEKIYDRIEGKQSMQGLLLDMVRENAV